MNNEDFEKNSVHPTFRYLQLTYGFTVIMNNWSQLKLNMYLALLLHC